MWKFLILQEDENILKIITRMTWFLMVLLLVWISRDFCHISWWLTVMDDNLRNISFHKIRYTYILYQNRLQTIDNISYCTLDSIAVLGSKTTPFKKLTNSFISFSKQVGLRKVKLRWLQESKVVLLFDAHLRTQSFCCKNCKKIALRKYYIRATQHRYTWY